MHRALLVRANGSIIHKRVQKVALSMLAPGDWCYVHNFLEPTSPLCLSFASGKGREFKQAMNHVIQSLRRDLPLAFESKKYLDARAQNYPRSRRKKRNPFSKSSVKKPRGVALDSKKTRWALVWSQCVTESH